jgi:hypothetical protein
LIAAKDLVAQILEHPFLASIAGYNGRIAIEGYLKKQAKTLDDHISQCKELAEQNNVLISLIFNIATLQDTRAAVEESKAANVFAASIRRVTMLTFVYLPLTLTSVRGQSSTSSFGRLTDAERFRNEHYPNNWRKQQLSIVGVSCSCNLAHGSNLWGLVYLVSDAD